ncbi:porin [Salinisphaera sp. Q1T1-3]|nr:porin [Salinisphaera sp. Q1T1-3]
MPASALAEITVKKGDAVGDWLNRIDIQVGGSIRWQYVNRMGAIDDGSYRHKIYDGGTRFRFTGTYRIDPNTYFKAYYEPGVDTFHLLGAANHYDGSDRRLTTRQRYIALHSDKWGELSIGKQNSIYYDTVGVKTDVWDDDMQAQGPSNGVNADYDGSYRGRRLVNYFNRLGNLDFYLSAILPSDTLDVPGGGPEYSRDFGGAIALNYHINDALELSAAYTYTRANLKQPRAGRDERVEKGQQLAGLGLLWTPGRWYGAIGGGYYRNFVPAGRPALSDYLARDAYGIEAYLSREFATPLGILKSTKPYIAADRLQRTSGNRYQSTHEYIGTSLMLAAGWRIDIERTFTQTSDDLPDENWVRLRYDF